MQGTESRWLWAVIALAVVLRLGAALYLGDRIEVLPGIHDQLSYDALARSILAGKGYTFDRPWYPFTPADTPTAHWSFLYPLYLAGVYGVFGYHPLIARLIQAVLSGVLLPWLVYRLGQRLFDERFGLVSAALSAVYIYFIYYDAALMTESFYTLSVLAMLNVALHIAGNSPQSTQSAQRNHWKENSAVPRMRSIRAFSVVNSYGRWVFLGIVLGVTTLLRQSILPWLPFLFFWLWWTTRKESRGLRITDHISRLMHYALRFALVLAVLTAFILPVTIRNYLVYDTFLPLNSNAGYALYSANHPDHGTSFMQAYAAPVPEELAGLNEAQLSSKLMALGFRFILQDPGRYILLSLSRVPIFFNFWPSPDSHPISNISRVLSYGLYLPFFLYGLFLSRHHWRRCSLVYLFGVIYSLMHILTWASIRYRLVIDAAFMPFAALAVVDLVGRVRSRWQSRASANQHTNSEEVLS